MPGTFTCSEDEDFGSLGDNKVIVTGGTSGTPAEFPAFVTADRAGTAVLLAATSCTINMTLTYQIRPVELLAIQLAFILAGTTAGAGDTLDITGTDWNGDAQSESIDVSAGDATYNGAKRWRTITDIDCTGWADGTLRVTQEQWGLVWDFGNASFYQYDGKAWDIGDNSTSTYFTSKKEAVYLSDGCNGPRVRHAATHQIGGLVGDGGVDGSYWSFGNTSSFFWGDWTSSSVKVYASQAHSRNSANIRFRFMTSGDGLDFRNSILSGTLAGVSNLFDFGYAEIVNYQRMYAHSLSDWGYYTNVATNITDGVHIHNCKYGIGGNAAGAELINTLITSSVTGDVNTQVNGTTVNRIDPSSISVGVVNNQADNWVQDTYTCNVKVLDRAGAALQSVTVLCEEQDDTEVFSVSTDASGDITEQQVRYKRWSGTAETLTDYSPHKFTLSKAGYKTLVLEAFTVDHPLVLHLELQSQTAPPRAWRH